MKKRFLVYKNTKNKKFGKVLKCILICIIMQLVLCGFYGTDKIFFIHAETDDWESEQKAEEELGDNIRELLDELDLQALQAYVDSLSVFGEGNVTERLIEYIKGESVDYQSVWKAVLEILFDNVQNMIPAFATIAAITLLAGILSMLKSGTAASTSADMIFLISYAATLIPLISVLTECFGSVFESVSQMQTQMQIVYPLLLTLMAASGGTVSAAIYKPAVAFFSNTIVSVIQSVVLPLTVAIIVFSLAGNLSKDLKISKFSAFFKSINKWLIGICISVFGLFFTLQGITASSYDGIVRRAAKYAIGNGIPIVGGFLSGGFDLAVAGSILIKNALGNMGIFLMIAVIFEPLVLLIATNVMLRFTAAITQLFGDNRISDFLGETADNLNYCTAGLLFTAFMYFLSIMLIVTSSEVLL